MTEWGQKFVRCRCVACGKTTMQPVASKADQVRWTKSWFCGCSPPPVGSALDHVDGEITKPAKEGE